MLLSNTADLMERLEAFDKLKADKKTTSVEETEQNTSTDVKKLIKSKKDMWSRILLEKQTFNYYIHNYILTRLFKTLYLQ